MIPIEKRLWSGLPLFLLVTAAFFFSPPTLARPGEDAPQPGPFAGSPDGNNANQRVAHVSVMGLTQLFPDPDSMQGVATAINNRGQIVGYCSTLASEHAFLWQDGRVLDLGTLDGDTESIPTAINEAGDVVGYSYADTIATRRAFLWRDGVMLDLGLPTSNANDINDLGQIVGSYVDPGSNEGHAFLWENGRVRDLGAFPEGRRSTAYGINNMGQIVGSAEDGDGSHAAFWQSGVWTNLETIPAVRRCLATGINDGGQVVGSCRGARPWEYQGFVWQSGVMKSLGSGWASKINARGLIVGQMIVQGSYEFGIFQDLDPAAWSPQQRIDLGFLEGGNESAAYGINDLGQVVGFTRCLGRSLSDKVPPRRIECDPGFGTRPTVWTVTLVRSGHQD